MNAVSPLPIDEILDRLSRVPRVCLAHLPTPLEPLPRLSAAVGEVSIFVKRDDCTGLACGGNKARHNEFIFGDALAKGADLFVWGAGVQSNNCRQTAAACAKLGLDCHLILGRNRPFTEGPDPIQGNLLLDHLLGATIEIVEEGLGSQLEARIAATAERYREAGRTPYFWDSPVVKPLAALAYVDALVELREQWPKERPDPAGIYVSSAGSTGAGAALGVALLGWNTRLRSIAPLQWEWDTQQEMADTARAAASRLDLEIPFPREQIDITFDWIPPGYGQASEAGLEAIALAARTEGLLLDPTYTGKALAGLIGDIRSGVLPPGSTAILIHTGGTPALFAESELLATRIPKKALTDLPRSP